MIFPFWLHLKHFKRAPVTMMLLALNIFFYLILPMKNGVNLPKELAQKISQRSFISVHSYLYEQYVKEHRPKEWLFWTDRFYQRKESIKGNEVEDFWFQTSFKDGEFLKVAAQQAPYPDEVSYQNWKKNFLEFENYQKHDYSGLFGVSTYGKSWSHYITYQFIHSGFLHLFSNMLILVLFGVLIELQVGSWMALFLYIAGGVGGGLFYSLTTGNNMAPLIGASGAVSALLSFYLLTEPRRYLRFFFFFFPSEDYFGDIYLSKWWLVPLLILSDINAILTVPDWSMNVAHAAHLGAILFGLCIGIVTRFFFSASLRETLSWISYPEEESLKPSDPSHGLL